MGEVRFPVSDAQGNTSWASCDVTLSGGEEGGVQARAADSLVESSGLVTHLDYSAYGDWPTMRQAILDLGVRHVRSGLNDPAEASYYDKHAELAGHGIRWCLAMRKWGPSTIASWLPRVIDRMGLEAFSGFEGSNEIGGRVFGAAHVDEAYANQRALWDTVRADDRLDHLAVGGPSMLATSNTQRDLLLAKDWAGIVDRGVQHLYPDGRHPLRPSEVNESYRHPYVAGKPWWVTETGYHNATITGGVDLTTEAIYMPRILFDWTWHRWGSDPCERVYKYELLSQGTDPSSRGDNWGLLDRDGTRQPAFDAYRRTLTLFDDPTDHTPGLLDYSVSGPSSLVHRLYQRSDGTFLLVVYRAGEVWDRANWQPDVPSPVDVTVTLHSSQRTLDEYVPRLSDVPVSTAPAASGHTVSVAGDVHVLALS